MIHRFKIIDRSMEPKLKEGDYVITISYIFSKPKIDDIIVFRQNEKYIIKRIKKISNVGYFVEGDNKKLSKKYGLIASHMILGKHILTIRS